MKFVSYMTKKIIAVILALIIALPSMIFASAAEIPTITVSSASAAPGDTVTLNVDLANNPGISAFSLGFEYDETKCKDTKNKEVLLEAQKNPEAYRNLIVRIWGWSAYFVELDKEYQDHVIKRQVYAI